MALRGQLGDLGSVLVLGLGKSGKSAARYCAGLIGSRVASLFVAAGARTEDSEAFVKELARGAACIEYAFGDDALVELKQAGQRFDLCIASPGIPYWHDLYVDGQAMSGELISEVEFAWRESAPKSTWVAITGTNGKTTTTACCAHVLRACGLAADAVGNIGEVCLDAVAAGRTDVYVAEVSSYQLHSTRLFAPDMVVMLNVTPDHVHWHKTFEAYRDAKFKVIDNVLAQAAAASSDGKGAGGDAGGVGAAMKRPLIILDATNDVTRGKVRELKALSRERDDFDYVPMGTAEGLSGDMRERCGALNAAFLDADGVLRIALRGVEHPVVGVDALQIKGEHNASNALAAAAVAVALGADDADIAGGLASFAPLEHRIEPCGDVAGVECYNDSKATNVDATVKALQAFPGRELIVLLGGDDKGTDLSELVEQTRRHARAAVCFGAAGTRFAQAFAQAGSSSDGLKVVRAGKLADALDAALGLANAGEVVLLSPACASFDEFRSFEHRGEVFKQLVAERSAAARALES